MKTLFHTSFKMAASFALLGITVNSFAGGVGTGGGDTMAPLSSAAEVSAEIDHAKERFSNDLFRPGGYPNSVILGDKSSDNFVLGANDDPHLLDLLKDLQRHSTFIFTIKIDKKIQGPCLDANGAPKEASVNMKDMFSPICFSIPLLQRLPKALLKIQVEGLLAHEATHKIGYGEVDAVLVQKFFVSELLSGRAEFRNRLGYFLYSAQGYAKQARDQIATSPQKVELKACSLLSQVKTAVDAYEELMIGPEGKQFVSKPKDSTFSNLAKKYGYPTDFFRVATLSSGEQEVISYNVLYCTGNMSASEMITHLDQLDKSAQNWRGLIPMFVPRGY